MTYNYEQDQIVPGVYVNPGSGPVANSDKGQAVANMAVLLADAGYSSAKYTFVRTEGDGRHTFTAHVPHGDIEVEMPGLPIDEVRFMGDPEQNIWDFPRLYVDGSSWVWKYAISSLQPDDD